MELFRIRPSLRRAAIVAALGALLAPATAGAADHAKATASAKKVKLPVVTSVRPMNVAIGETLEIRGRNFLRGRNKNSVVFRRDGGKAVFVKADVGTAKLLKVKIPDKLTAQFARVNHAPAPTRFRLRVFARKFGKSFTKVRMSPTISPPRPPVPPGFVQSQPDGDCDGDGTKNRSDGDDDNDGLTDTVEQSLDLNPCVVDTDTDGLEDRWEFDCDRDGALNRDETDDDADLLTDDVEAYAGTDGCNADSDGDRVEDGYEYQSARDLNDDEYQTPQSHLPYPGVRPYPNALDPGDGNTDYDGDSLTLAEEYGLWIYTYTVTRTDTRSLSSLSYSDGEQHTRSTRGADGRRVPTLAASTYDKHQGFLAWAQSTGYSTVVLENWADGGDTASTYSLFDINRDGSDSATEEFYNDRDQSGYLSDDERDEDADGLTNYDETHGRMTQAYWTSCYQKELKFHVEYAGTDVGSADTDGDGVRDGADDQDHDDIPNMVELSRYEASGHSDWDSTKGLCRPQEVPPLPETLHSSDYGRVNPFNPCLPATFARTCPRYVNGTTGAPFDGSPNWWSLQ